MRFEIRVKPGARADYVGGSWGGQGALVVAVQASAVDGKANKAVLALLATAFDVHKNSVQLVTGAKNRTKLIELTAPSADAAHRLSELLGT